MCFKPSCFYSFLVTNKPKRLDYLEEYQTIKTFGQTLDAEVFTIPDEGMFVAFANVARNRKNVSVVYKWSEEQFVPYQRLKTNAAQSWESFKINNDVSIMSSTAVCFVEL